MIKIYCGESIQHLCKDEHPYTDVLYAMQLVETKTQSDLIKYTNSPDFIAAAFHYANKKSIGVEFYLNGVLQDGIEDIFEDFNRALDLINKIINDV